MHNSVRNTLLCAAVVVGTLGTAQAEVNVVTWGGAYAAGQQKAYGETWKGDKINWINYNGGLGEIRTQVESGSVKWDVVDVLPAQARTGCDEGLFEPLDRGMFVPAPDGTPMDKDTMNVVPNNCVVPNIFWSYLAFYEEGTFKGEQPSTIEDFFDVKKFPGKRGIPNWPNALIEMALLADGVPIDQIYQVMSTEKGIDRAFAKLDQIKEHAVFWTAGSKPIELVKSGETSMSLAYNGRVGAAVLNEGEKLVPIWDGQLIDEEWWVLVKGSPNAEAAKKFLVHVSAPQQQAGQAKWINYGPMRKSSLEIIKANEPWYHTGVNIMPYMPIREEVLARSIFADPAWWADYGEELGERYTAWTSQ